MTRRLLYLDSALDDLMAIARHIADESGDRAVATQFAERMRDKCRRLAALPGTLGTARPDLLPDIRSTPFQAHVIFFRYGEDVVEIVNILHARRDVEGFFAR